MKTVIVSLLTGIFANSFALASDELPSGFIQASSKFVRLNSSVNLEWEVSVPPRKVEDIIKIDDDGTITPLEDVAFNVRLLGAEYAASGNYAKVGGWYTYGKSPWLGFFWGYGDDPKALSRNTCDILRTGEDLRFIFRGSKNGFRGMPGLLTKWHKQRYSGKQPSWGKKNNPAIVLKDGDPLPEFAIPEGQHGIASFLAPYLNETADRVEIGPLDLIVLADLDSPKGDKNADYQDMVILVTFSRPQDTDCIRRWKPKPPKPSTGGSSGGGGSSKPKPLPEYPEWAKDLIPQ